MSVMNSVSDSGDGSGVMSMKEAKDIVAKEKSIFGERELESSRLVIAYLEFRHKLDAEPRRKKLLSLDVARW